MPSPVGRRFASVIFDCDSTLTSIEGIEVLAVHHRDEVARLTEAAMRGEVPLEEVYARRLAMIRPTRDAVTALGARYVETLVVDARDVVAALAGEGIAVRIVSGGLRPPVLALARALGIPDDDVAAVDIAFDERGAYAGFDASSPLARTGGKGATLEAWSDSLARPAMFVGDGATDLEARPFVDAFVAFAGVVERPAVIAAADVVLRAPSLAPVLALALGGEPPASAQYLDLFHRGLALLGASAPTLERVR
ncbi:MAG: HAD-IB family phosphatase [Gemmatimonadaceae bacterium]